MKQNNIALAKLFGAMELREINRMTWAEAYEALAAEIGARKEKKK